MADGKNQHYVPKHYFRIFTNDAEGKRINLIHRKSGSPVIGAAIKSQASGDYFYGAKEIEDSVTGLENLHRGALKSIAQWATDETPMPNDDIWAMAISGILFQRARTQLERDKCEDAASRLLQEQLRIQINADKTIEKRERLLDELHRVRANPAKFQGMKLVFAMQSTILLSDLERLVLVNRSVVPFAFGDSPVVFYNLHLRNVRDWGVLGFQSPGLIVYYPLSPTVAVLLIDRATYGHQAVQGRIVIVDPEEIRRLNALELHHAGNALYFGNATDRDEMVALWQREASSLGRVQDQLNKGPGFTQDGKRMGDIIHLYEPQVGYLWEPGFIKYSTVANPEHQGYARSPGLVRQFEAMVESEKGPFWGTPSEE